MGGVFCKAILPIYTGPLTLYWGVNKKDNLSSTIHEKSLQLLLYSVHSLQIYTVDRKEEEVCCKGIAKRAINQKGERYKSDKDKKNSVDRC